MKIDGAQLTIPSELSRCILGDSATHLGEVVVRVDIDGPKVGSVVCINTKGSLSAKGAGGLSLAIFPNGPGLCVGFEVILDCQGDASLG